jgi:hypothetical protein
MYQYYGVQIAMRNMKNEAFKKYYDSIRITLNDEVIDRIEGQRGLAGRR